MKIYLPEPIVAQASVSLQHIESQKSQNRTQSQAELTKFFQSLRSHLLTAGDAA
ncbi:hypothetical protein NDA01_23870 [Trichocoleus desertorum AS-A10]|uniref:hypothetical protein n=1 Tax=Trichocoleus desertorum TaxID=1481672 RepID=UPI0032999BB1